MLAKTLCVVFLVTFSVSLAKEDDFVNTFLTAGTNIIKEVAKVASNDPEKYSVDLNAFYKKYKVEEKSNMARSFLQTQFKRGIELTHENIRQADIIGEEGLKKSVEIIKKKDPVLGEKLYTLYEKIVEYDRISEDIFKHIYSADKITRYYDKVSFKPVEQILTEIVKKLESGTLEVIKKGKEV